MWLIPVLGHSTHKDVWLIPPLGHSTHKDVWKIPPLGHSTHKDVRLITQHFHSTHKDVWLIPLLGHSTHKDEWLHYDGAATLVILTVSDVSNIYWATGLTVCSPTSHMPVSRPPNCYDVTKSDSSLWGIMQG